MAETNPLSQYLFKLINTPDLSDDFSKKELLARLEISTRQFKKLLKHLDQYWGLERNSQESWLEFLERAAFEIDTYTHVSQQITQGRVPENIKDLVTKLDAYQKELNQNRAEISSQIETKFSQPEVDRLIIYLKEENDGRLPDQLTEQQIANAKAEITLNDEINRLPDLKITAAENRPEKSQQWAEAVLDMHSQQVEAIVRAGSPESQISQEELNFITTGSLGKISLWRKTIQQKCDNYAEIISQVETVADTATLAQKAVIAEKVQPVIEEYSEVDPELSKEISRDIAGSLMTAKSQNWDLKPGPKTETGVATPQIALAFSNRRINLNKNFPVEKIAKSAFDQLSKMEIKADSIQKINQVSIQANVANHLINKGLSLPAEQTSQSAESMSYGFRIPYRFEPIKEAYQHTHQEKGEEITKPSLLKRLSHIPQDPDQILRVYKESPYQEIYRQIFISHFSQNFTSQELNQEIAVLSQMQSFARTTTARGPVIDMHGIQLEAAQTVINNPLYRTMSPLIKLGKTKLAKKIGQTAIGKGVKTGISKAGSWLAKKAGFSGIKLAGGKAVSGIIATTLGVPSGGASILIWAGLELLKTAGKKLFSGIKGAFTGIASGVSGFFADIFSSGKAEASKQKAGIANRLQKGLYSAGAAIGALISLPLAFNPGPIIVFSFVAFFGVMLLGFLPQHLSTQSRRRPPLGRGDERGVAPSELGIDAIEVDLESCEIPSSNAMLACALEQAFSQCFPEAKITRSNSHQVDECIRRTETLMTMLSEAQISHIVNAINYSANTYTVLQCVGFKRAVEPGLPGCGDAKHFVNAGCNRCRPAEAIEPGINAVFTGGAYGHIAIVLEADALNGLVTLAQAWGGSGQVSITRVPIVSVAEFIDCR